MKMYKIWDYHIPEEVFPLGDAQEGFDVRTKSSYVVLEHESKKELSLYSGTYRVKIQIDGIKFSSEKINVGDYYITKFKKIGFDAPWVVHKNRFDRKEIIKDAFGLEISDKDDNEIKFKIKAQSDLVSITFTSPESVKIEIDKEGNIKVDATSAESIDIEKDTLTIKNTLSGKQIFDLISSRTPLAELVDSDSSNYYIKYDIANKTFIKKDIELGDYIIDKYSDVLLNIKGTPIYANIRVFYLNNEERFLGKEELSVATGENDVVYSSPLSRIVSSFIEYKDKNAIYNYGIFKSTDRLVPMYAYVGSTYAYVKWYRAKASVNECEYSDDGSLEEVLKIKIKKGKGIEIKTDKTGMTEFMDTSAVFGDKFLNSLKNGFGVWSNSMFRLKKYQDDGQKTTIKFNYKNSKTYYLIEIYDENTRYKIVETKKVDGDTQQKTYYYYRYRKEPEKELGGTDSVVFVRKKEIIDFSTDINTGIVNVSSVTVDSLTVVSYSGALIVNPLSVKVKFPSDKMSTETFGKTVLSSDDTLTFYKIMYQGTSDTIYVLDDDGNSMSIADFIEMFNETVTNYKMQEACAYSVLSYKSIDGKSYDIQFPLSTLFLIELINTKAGISYRIYYKNSYDIGFVEAVEYDIKDL